MLAIEGSAGHRVAFTSGCGCGTAYLIETARDGAHCTGAGTPDEIMQRYASLPGDEYTLSDEHGIFF